MAKKLLKIKLRSKIISKLRTSLFMYISKYLGILKKVKSRQREPSVKTLRSPHGGIQHRVLSSGAKK